MFSNYQNLSEYYTPNNLAKYQTTPSSYTKLDPIKASKPYELYNAKGQLEGYYWNEGEVLNLEFNLEGEITVEGDALIYTASGECPNVQTKGRLNQVAYNITDEKKWELIQIVEDTLSYYIWAERAFEVPSEGEKGIYVSAEDYLSDKELIFKILNFRHEVIFEKTFKGTTKLIIPVGQKSNIYLKKGIYYCILKCAGDQSVENLFDSNDCKLLVK
jgi:hypothetical protein